MLSILSVVFNYYEFRRFSVSLRITILRWTETVIYVFIKTKTEKNQFMEIYPGGVWVEFLLGVPIYLNCMIVIMVVIMNSYLQIYLGYSEASLRSSRTYYFTWLMFFFKNIKHKSDFTEIFSQIILVNVTLYVMLNVVSCRMFNKGAWTWLAFFEFHCWSYFFWFF